MENIGLNRSREGKTFWFQVSSFFDERSGRAERRFQVKNLRIGKGLAANAAGLLLLKDPTGVK